MAFVTNSNQRLSLNDGMLNLTERERKFLEKSWAKVFSEKIFPAIDEDIFLFFTAIRLRVPIHQLTSLLVP